MASIHGARSSLPLVYSCSGCSSAAQLANHLAVRFDREGLAEMSCIAGVGGNVASLVRKVVDAVAAGRAIVALDGCALACVRSCLAQRGVAPTRHVALWLDGVPKVLGADFDPADAERIHASLGPQLRALAVAAEPRTAATAT